MCTHIYMVYEFTVHSVSDNAECESVRHMLALSVLTLTHENNYFCGYHSSNYLHGK